MTPAAKRHILLLLSPACTAYALVVLKFRKVGTTPLLEIGVLLIVSLLAMVAFVRAENRHWAEEDPVLYRGMWCRRLSYGAIAVARLFVPLNVLLYREGLLPLQSGAGVGWVFASLVLIVVAAVLQFAGAHPTVRELRFAPLLLIGVAVAELAVYVVWIVGA